MSEIIKITNLSAPELDIYARLNEAQLLHYYEPCKEGIFIAESPKVIGRALDAGYEPISMLMERSSIDGEARDIVSRCNVPVYIADEEILTEITGFKLTRGALCAMRRKPLPSVDEVCDGARRVAVLENVMNPTNVGAIFRSAAALNMDAVLLTDGCSDPLYRRAERVSMGTVFQVKWTYFDGSMDTLKRLGFATAAMALDDNSVSVSDPALAREKKLAVVLGTEGDGLAPKTITDCDYTVKIPMSHGVDSLNVAAASAVAFWELGK